MRNTFLSKLYKVLKRKYHVCFRDDHVLELSVDDKTLPYFFFITEITDVIYIYVSCELNDKKFEDELLHMCNRYTQSVIVGEFYFGNNGTLYLNEDAEKYYELEQLVNLEEINPISNYLH